MIKTVLILILVVAFVLLGIKISEYYKRRTKFFDDYIRYLELSIIAVSYSHDNLLKVVEQGKGMFAIDFEEVLKIFKILLKNEIQKENFEKLLNKKLNFLKQDEKTELINFLYSLGAGDEESEIYKMTALKLRVENLHKKVDNERKVYSPLYLKLGVVLGILSFILFI